MVEATPSDQTNNQTTDVPVGDASTWIGIHVGNTNTRAAIIQLNPDGQGQEICMLCDPQTGSSQSPSVVGFEGGGRVKTGAHAMENFLHNKNRTVFDSKRVLGQEYKVGLLKMRSSNIKKSYPARYPHLIISSTCSGGFGKASAVAKRESHTSTLKIDPLQNEKRDRSNQFVFWMTIEDEQRAYMAQDFVCHLIKERVELAESQTGSSITNAVITVPAYFTKR